jgi:hypothetical protein
VHSKGGLRLDGGVEVVDYCMSREYVLDSILDAVDE